MFINSDPDLVQLFLVFVRALGVSDERLALRVQIHETADVDAATRYWSEVAGIPVASFGKPTLKRHRPKTVRKNVGEHYHGCLTVTVRQSAELYRRIEGWVRGIMVGVAGFEQRQGSVSPAPAVDVGQLRNRLMRQSRVV